jgi:hypothetical protein
MGAVAPSVPLLPQRGKKVALVNPARRHSAERTSFIEECDQSSEQEICGNDKGESGIQ